MLGSSRLPRLPAAGIRLERLEAMPLVLTSAWHHIRRDLERMFHEKDMRVQVVAEVDSVAIVKELVRQGHAYGVLPRWAVFNELRRRQLTAVPLHGIDSWTELMLMWLRSRTLSPAARHLRRIAVEEISKLITQGWGNAIELPAEYTAPG